MSNWTTRRCAISQIANLWPSQMRMLPLSVAVDMLKITNNLKAFVVK